jgi:hypothetical protein
MTCVLIVKCLMLLFFKVKCSTLITDIKYWIIYKDNNGISDKKQESALFSKNVISNNTLIYVYYQVI